MSDLGSILQDQQDHLNEGTLSTCIKWLKELHGLKHTLTLGAVSDLAGLLQEQNKFDEAEPLFKHALNGYEELLGPKHPDTLKSVTDLASF